MAANYNYGGDPYSMDALMPPDLGELLATLMPPAKDQSRLPSLPMPQQPAPRPDNRPVSDKSGQAPRAMPQPAAAPLSALGRTLNPIDALTALAKAKPAAPRPAATRPAGSGPRVNDYKAALVRAQQAGDEEAIAHFQSQIDKGLASVKGRAGSEKPIPQGGNILDAAIGGLPFSDELAGAGAGLASMGMGALGLQPDKGVAGNFSRGYDLITGDMRKRKGEFRERNPMTSMATEIGTGLATAGPLGLLRAGLPAALTTGAVYGAGEGDGGIAERAKSAVTGGITGGVVHAGGQALSRLGRVLFPAVAPKAKGPGFQSQVKTLEDAGLKVTSAEKIASPQARMAERMTASYFNQGADIAARPQQLYGQLMKRAGFHPDDVAAGELSAEAVSRASKRFSDDYDRVLAGAKVKLPDMDPFMQRIEAGVAQLLPHEVMGAAKTAQRIIRSFRDEIGQNRTITGTDYKRIRSDLGKQATRAARSDVANWTAPIYKALQANLDDAFRQGAHPSRVAALRKIDSKYGAYKILQKAQANPEAIGTMATDAFHNKGRVDAEFVKLARAYQNVLLRGYPQSSGTAENIASMGWIPPVMSMARATGAKASAATRNMHLPLPQGSGSFIAGQQAPNSGAEDLVKALGELR